MAIDSLAVTSALEKSPGGSYHAVVAFAREKPSESSDDITKEGDAMKRAFRTQHIVAVCIPIAFAIACTCLRAQTREAEEAASAARAERPSVHVDRWLVLGPFPSPVPAFAAEDGEAYDASKLLSYEEMAIESMKPAEGGRRSLLLGSYAAWKAASADSNGVSLPRDPAEPAIAYLAAYIEVPRWMKVDVSVRASDAFMAAIDGAEVIKSPKAAGFAERKSHEAKLERGKHLLLVKTVHMPSDTAADWRLDVSLSASASSDVSPLISISPDHDISLNEILYLQQITGTAISPDGGLVAITTGKYSRADQKHQSWVEIRSFENGALVRTIRDVGRMSDVKWAPTGKRLSYIVGGEKDTGSLRVLDLDAGACGTAIENVENLDGYLWRRDGRAIVYSVSEKPEPDSRGVRHLTNIEDRQRGGGGRSYLYVTTFPEGETRRLTSGTRRTGVYDTHPDGRRILIWRNYEDLSQRPYATTELSIMNLADQSVELLYAGHWLNDASFSPDGKKILILAGPSAFGASGLKVSEGMIPNDYDGELYLFDVATRTAEPLTRDFDPAVTSATWSKVDGNIYLVAEDRSYKRLFRCNPRRRTFERIDTGFEAEHNGDIASGKLRAAYVGSGATQPPRLYAIDLARGASRMIYDPAADDFLGVSQGAVVDWNFTSASGKTIEGYYYLPPGFDPQKKYPCIVYYYGGTSPTTRYFNGRYPKNLWAAEGYVVYVLQPSGATGFGQQFSAYHVNDWGKIVAGEIIEGTKKFIEAHPFVNVKKLGCIGASYGGFMTELLVTKTDIFAAAVSHAGISSIASYWGEGYWGYAYNAVAAANSFPWNRRDIYVDQSPLFSADKIKTPLLLLHGAEDTNVPLGESEQLFTALKLLGRTVEYIQIEGQNHTIMDYAKRDIWSKTIIAWFDRFLKNEPEWWNDLYPAAPGGAGEPAAQQGAAAREPAPLEEPAPLSATVIEKTDGSKEVLGNVTRDDIVANIAGWDAGYFDYKPDASILGEISGRLNSVTIVVVFGTWCSDSRREVPRLWKVLDEIAFPTANVKMLAVERAKVPDDAGLARAAADWSKSARDYYGIKAVESIIVYRGGAEIGRIVEAPVTSIEADLLEILKR
jgi:dipeptidyl aminopeptidase/acylaminoacyl peptidase